MYGIGMAAEGINRGIEQHRQIGRQEAQDEQQRKLQNAQLENYGLRMDATRQQMGHRDTEMGWKQDANEAARQERERLEAIRRGQAAAQLGDFDTVGNSMAQIYGFQRGQIVPEDDGYHAYFYDDDGDEPALESRIDQQEFRHFLSGAPEQIAIEAEAERQAIAEAKREAEQARLEHERALQEQALQQGTIQGRISEDGRFGISNAPEGETGDPTANQRDVTDIAEAFGISRSEAWRMVQTARQEHPAKAIREIAADLSRNSYEYRNDPDAAYDRATELYQRINQGVGYGVTANPPPSDGPLDQVVQGASREIKGQQAEQMLAEAEELAQESPADVARIAGILVREGVLSEQQAQEWQRTHKGGRSGIGLSAFDQWQQR